MPSKTTGPSLVGLAAILWATDTLFRFPAVNQLSPVFIVFCEHVVALTVLLPWMLLFRRKEMFNLTFPQWLGALIIGAGSSALATILFTASFRHVNPSVAILLQKLQPVIVVLLAFVFLKERPKGHFYRWAGLAITAAIWLSFPDLRVLSVAKVIDPHSLGVLYAMAAAGIWAVGTVAGKAFLKTSEPTVATFWRFAFGLLMLSAILVSGGGSLPSSHFIETPVAHSLVYMGLVPGLLAILIYYYGLERTSASTATFVELLFPVGAVLINTFFLNMPLNLAQLAAAACLLFFVTRISIESA